MKRILPLILLFLSIAAWSLKAQVFIINDNMMAARMGEIRATVVDSLTNEPVPFASVYIIPAKDTTITNFTLTDTLGVAKLDEIPFGSYTLHIEMMGYLPFVKERYLRNRVLDLGTIKLQEDKNFLDAAMVSDVGNAVIVKQDTVEFNASAFRVGANAMLRDLIRRMPGMEITDDGKVKFNGEEIDRLTVGGRTFFFGDQTVALNNLPASIVDKIKVIDRESESTRATGVQDGQREKVMDISLKKQYEQGWFGNAGINGGVSTGPGDDEQMKEGGKFLYAANALVSAYSDKDQVTFVANTQNVSQGPGMVFMATDGGAFYGGQGLTTAVQAGVNANTSRIKEVETTASVNYNYSDTETGTRSNRVTYQTEAPWETASTSAGRNYSTALSTNLEMKKETGKVVFNFVPSFRYSESESINESSSETVSGGARLNSSSGNTHSKNYSNTAGLFSSLTIRSLGKEGRTLGFHFNGSLGNTNGESTEMSTFLSSGGTDLRDLRYTPEGKSNSFGTGISYTEPISNKLTLTASASIERSGNKNTKDAFSADGTKNDYYSSVSNSHVRNQGYRVSAQYKFLPQSYLTLGARLEGVLQETYSESYGISTTTGEDEINWFLTPTIALQHSKNNNRIFIEAGGRNQRPANTQMLPVMDISNPAHPGLGNIYLRPYSRVSGSFNWTRSNPKRFSNLMASVYAGLTNRYITGARWYDTDGIMYTMPVNSEKPDGSFALYSSYTTPIDSKRLWSVTIGLMSPISFSHSYQAVKALDGLNKDNFDYSDFIRSFWGNSKGDLFYSGESGFKRTSTSTFSPNINAGLKYNQQDYWVSLWASHSRYIASYSLDSMADLNTSTTNFRIDGSYTTKHLFELASDIAYVFYTGYSEGYGRPEWQWNASVSKNIGSFTLSLTAKDILDQTRSLSHIANANYEEDSYRLVLGRYVLFGVKWNFGKMNASQNKRATNAAWRMAW